MNKGILKDTKKAAGSGRKCLTAFVALWIVMRLAAQSQSPYISKVYDFMPAPGQFVNEMPAYAPGDTQEDMNRKVEETIAGANHNEGMITLGGFGGYIVFGFDHEVTNEPGRYDFRILGNAFYADANPNGDTSREGGSCEPGIVMVSRDVNGNGLPDDPWYELAGSDYHHPATIHNYRITYYKPDENKVRDPDPNYPAINDRTYIRWTTNGHGDGYLFRNIYHTQSYYPRWTGGETLSFEGTKLADNYVDESGKGSYYVQYASHWGYADNHPNADGRSGFNIEWAVDAGGNPVALPGIHFVKVYTAVNQYCGWLGETSTEIAGAEDLHLTGRDAAVPVFVSGITLNRSAASLTAGQTLTLSADVTPANAADRRVTWQSSNAAVASVANGTVMALANGTAVIRAIANDGYYVAECNISVASGGQVDPDPDPGPGTDPDPDPQPGGTKVTGVTLSRTQMEMKPGDMTPLVATVTPSTATNRAVNWSTSAARVAEVTVNGLVLAGEPGTAIITVTTVDGQRTASCTVQVRNASANDDVTADRPQATAAAGILHLVRLDGYDCALFTATGQLISAFRPASPDEYRPCSLTPGIYILTARKQGEEKQIVIKLKF
ncbi:MAG: Ig-like domain-containing protein [Tannerella sp.]|jgi:uncharacterized protein YjdB|nr:Ig-like domain-containing protein [Tannerella sp.]